MPTDLLLSKEEAQAYLDADASNLVPEGDYRVKILRVARMENKPETIQWVFKIMGGQEAAGRQLRAWTNTSVAAIWALKRLIGDLVVDPATVQDADLEDKIVTAHVTIEKRSDTGEDTNRVNRLSPWTGGGTDEDEPVLGDDDGECMPF
jgi:hypothetical protein